MVASALVPMGPGHLQQLPPPQQQQQPLKWTHVSFLRYLSVCRSCCWSAACCCRDAKALHLLPGLAPLPERWCLPPGLQLGGERSPSAWFMCCMLQLPQGMLQSWHAVACVSVMVLFQGIRDPWVCPAAAGGPRAGGCGSQLVWLASAAGSADHCLVPPTLCCKERSPRSRSSSHSSADGCLGQAGGGAGAAAGGPRRHVDCNATAVPASCQPLCSLSST
jgi:hypothetical protein